MGNFISIIIPAYNAETTIEKCIQSIQGQNIEIIVVIDGATDHTLEICKQLQKTKANLEIIEQTNQGADKARTAGIMQATGDYVMFLDADDCYFENTISKMQEMIKKYDEPDLIRFRYKKVPDGYEQYRYMEADEQKIEKQEFAEKVYPMFLNGYMLNALWTNCIKKDIIQSIEMSVDNIIYAEDLVCNLQIFSKIQNVVFLSDVLYQYTYTESSITNTKSIKKLIKHVEDAIKVYSSLHTYLIQWNMNNIENTEIVNKRIQKEVDSLLNIIRRIAPPL